MLEWLPEDSRVAVQRRLEATLRSLASEPNLRVVLNWQTGRWPLVGAHDRTPPVPASKAVAHASPTP